MIRIALFALALAAAFTPVEPSSAAEPNGIDALTAKDSPLVKGEVIAFFGDSITQPGARPNGYCRLIAKAIEKHRPELGVKIIYAGISGHKILTSDGVHLNKAGNEFVAAQAAIAIAKALENKNPAGGSKSTSLFNGKDLGGWHIDAPRLDKNPDGKKPFIVRDGKLVSLGRPGGHLITDAKYENYRLKVEYRFAAKPGNCGVLVHASKPRALYKMFPKSIEVQMNHRHAGDFWCIAEDITVPDMVKRRGPKEKWGVTEGKARRILNLTDGSEKPAGKWNTMVIECVKDAVKVWVNGDLVNHGTGCTASKGQIALQAEGVEVEFRTLLLTPISKLSD